MKKISLISLFSLFTLLTSCEMPGPEKLIPKSLISSDAPADTTTTQTPALEKNTLSCEEARFVVLLNLYRVQNKLSLLKVSESGVEGARWHAEDMNDKNYFSHTEPDGRTFAERARSFGYAAWAENIAAGNKSAALTFCQWKNSAGHNTNMLRAENRSIGIGEYSGSGTYKHYWVNTFGPDVQDDITEPLTRESGCLLPTALPSC
jgi:uncharacterized protein YkwD